MIRYRVQFRLRLWGVAGRPSRRVFLAKEQFKIGYSRVIYNLVVHKKQLTNILNRLITLFFLPVYIDPFFPVVYIICIIFCIIL